MSDHLSEKPDMICLIYDGRLTQFWFDCKHTLGTMSLVLVNSVTCLLNRGSMHCCIQKNSFRFGVAECPIQQLWSCRDDHLRLFGVSSRNSNE